MNNSRIFRDFLTYVSLNILGQMAYSCYTLADTFFVAASLGTDGLTALNLAFPFFCLMNGIGLMIGMGGGTRYSILRSRGKSKEANYIFTSALYLVIFFALLFSLSGLFLSDTLTRLLGANNAVFAPTHIYLKVMLLFAPAFLTNNLLQCFVRNDGNPSLSMTAMFTGCFCNIVLDYIFIFPLHMGIFGAIFATGLSPVISMLVLSSHFIRRKNHFHPVRHRPQREEIGDLVSCGIPPLITEASSGVVMFVFNFIILRLSGNTGVAAFGVVSAISLVVIAMYTGLSQGIQPLLSLNHGTQNKANIKALRKYALIAMLLLSGVIYGIIFFCAPQITMAFNSDKDPLLQDLAVTGLKLYFLACPLTGFNIITSTQLASTERTRPAQLISCLRGFILLIPMAFLLSALGGLTGTWFAYPLTEGIVTLAAILLCHGHKSQAK